MFMKKKVIIGVSVVADTTLVYNDKLYSGSGITLELLDRLSGIKRQ